MAASPCPARPSTTRSPVPEVVEPGTRLVQRYRLEQRLDGAGGDRADGAGMAADGAEVAHLTGRADVTGRAEVTGRADGAARADGAGRVDGAGRADRALDAGGTTLATPWTYWRAEDELLARPVSVCLIDANGS